MGISTEDIERIRATVKLSDVVQSHAALRRVGARWVGRCPFHAEKTGSFNVNDELGFYKCFGCGVSGDVITFVREIEHLDFVGALEQLAAKAQLTLTYTTTGESKERQRAKQLKEAMGLAVSWYHDRLLTGADAGPARAYLRGRGIDGAIVRHFKIGWAPEGWDELARGLKLGDGILRDSGLGFLNNRGRPTDAFRARIVFPIFDERGDAVALGARVMPGADGAKYKNSPETPIYSKSRTLYGLNWAKDSAVRDDELVVCEGYTDVIGFHQAGVAKAIATCGTALTEDHVRVMRKFASRIVLAFDADAAGQSAADRVYAWEKSHDITVAVASFPRGSDPGELARSDPEALAAAVRDAKPFLAFRIDRRLGGAQLHTPEQRAKAAEAALEIVNEHPNVIVRREYASQVAVRCSLPVNDMVALAERGQRRPSVRVVEALRASTDGPEVTVLGLLVHHWDATAMHVVPAMFTEPENRAAVDALAAANGEVRAAIEHADPAAAELLLRLAVEEPALDPMVETQRLLKRSVEAVLAGQRAGVSASEFLRTSATIRTLLHQLDAPDTEPAATSELLGWLDGLEQE